MATHDELSELVGELDRLAERLADLALDRLRSAMDPDDPDPAAMAEERRITRARRAVEKASAILARPPVADGAT